MTDSGSTQPELGEVTQRRGSPSRKWGGCIRRDISELKWDGCVEGVYVRNDTDHELTPVALYSVPTACCGLPLLSQPHGQ